MVDSKEEAIGRAGEALHQVDGVEIFVVFEVACKKKLPAVSDNALAGAV
jgi:hypothetical protein